MRSGGARGGLADPCGGGGPLRVFVRRRFDCQGVLVRRFQASLAAGRVPCRWKIQITPGEENLPIMYLPSVGILVSLATVLSRMTRVPPGWAPFSLSFHGLAAIVKAADTGSCASVRVPGGVPRWRFVCLSISGLLRSWRLRRWLVKVPSHVMSCRESTR